MSLRSLITVATMLCCIFILVGMADASRNHRRGHNSAIKHHHAHVAVHRRITRFDYMWSGVTDLYHPGNAVYDYRGYVIGYDPDPNVRFEMRRDWRGRDY